MHNPEIAPSTHPQFSFTNIQTWLRSKEVSFREALRTYSGPYGLSIQDILPPESLLPWKSVLDVKFPIGWERFKSTKDDQSLSIFTGANLCGSACMAIYIAAKEKFGPDIELVPHLQEVFFPMRGRKGHHVTLFLRDNLNDEYFIDPTYGQINFRLNRIIIDTSNNYNNYYPNAKKLVTNREYQSTFFEDATRYAKRPDLDSVSIPYFYDLIDSLGD